jgi:glutathione peroxidase
MKLHKALTLILSLAGITACTPGLSDEAAEADSPWAFTVKDIQGNEVDLAKYKGQVALIVNVASKCGLTPQYEQLNAVYEKYKDRGFAMLGFPANNFMGQEPGTNEQIQQFCKVNYGVTFDIFSKISVKGKDMAPLYQFLTSKEKNGEFGGNISWNFDKFLVSRDGKVIARFNPRTKPDAAEVITAIEKALAAEPPST